MTPAAESSACSGSNLIHRRGVLGTIGMAGAAWAASSALGMAAGPQKGKLGAPRVSVATSSASRRPTVVAQFERPDVPDVPDEWLALNPQAYDYLRYLHKLQFKAVRPAQVIEVHAKRRGGVWNSLPPKQWWSRQAYNLRVVDRIAQMMNVHEVEVVSAYRTPAYNSRCPGAASSSYHQVNVATDVVFPVRASQVTAFARNVRDRGLFKGGVGGYGGFTHIDTRGKNVNW